MSKIHRKYSTKEKLRRQSGQGERNRNIKVIKHVFPWWKLCLTKLIFQAATFGDFFASSDIHHLYVFLKKTCQHLSRAVSGHPLYWDLETWPWVPALWCRFSGLPHGCTGLEVSKAASWKSRPPETWCRRWANVAVAQPLIPPKQRHTCPFQILRFHVIFHLVKLKWCC